MEEKWKCVWIIYSWKLWNPDGTMLAIHGVLIKAEGNLPWSLFYSLGSQFHLSCCPQRVLCAWRNCHSNIFPARRISGILKMFGFVWLLSVEMAFFFDKIIFERPHASPVDFNYVHSIRQNNVHILQYLMFSTLSSYWEVWGTGVTERVSEMTFFRKDSSCNTIYWPLNFLYFL